MSSSGSTPPRQRRIASSVFLGVGLINLVVGIVAGAVVTVVASAVLLAVGGVLLLSNVRGSGRPSD